MAVGTTYRSRLVDPWQVLPLQAGVEEGAQQAAKLGPLRDPGLLAVRLAIDLCWTSTGVLVIQYGRGTQLTCQILSLR